MSQETKSKLSESHLEESPKSKPEATISKTELKPKKFTWLVWLLAGILLMTAVFGWQYYQFNRKATLRREGVKIQQEKMLKFWQEQGLTQAEIDLKLKADRQQNFRTDGEPDFYRTIMRTVNHGIGGAPQGGRMGGGR